MRSLLATKGHFIRLNILQSVCILPMILTSFAGAIVRYAGGGNTVGLVAEALVTVAGTLYSILLYTQLAEDEYKKLASAL